MKEISIVIVCYQNTVFEYTRTKLSWNKQKNQKKKKEKTVKPLEI